MANNAYECSIEEAAAGGVRVQGQPGLHSETGEKRERGRGDWRKQKERGEKLGRSPGGSVKW